MNIKKVKISSLLPNPYRNIEDYPIDKEKVDLLVESFGRTGFWGNIVARPKGRKFEIAYGHHRLVALRKKFGKNALVPIVVNALSNEHMLQMMAAENLEEFGRSSAFVEMETIQQTIAAYAAGEIELPKVPKDTNKGHIRDASPGSAKRYTMGTVARFHGWTKGSKQEPDHKCRVAFDMLDAVNEGVVTRKQLKNLSREAASQIVSSAMAIKRENERVAVSKAKQAQQVKERAETYTGKKKQAAEKLAGQLEHESRAAANSAAKKAQQFAAENAEKVREGKRSVRDVRLAASEVKAEARKQDRQAKVKDAKRHLADYADQISLTLNKSDGMHESMLVLLKGDFGLDSSDVRMLQKEVDSLITRANSFWDYLESWEPTGSSVELV